MGFDAVSLWDFRRDKKNTRDKSSSEREIVDAWGRIYKNGWYSWDGVFKNKKIVKNWSKLKPPNSHDIKILKNFLTRTEGIDFVLSLPGLFEKTWQSMGFVTFSKALKEDRALLRTVIQFFYEYLRELIISLQEAGASLFLIADDMGYKQRTFIPKTSIRELFFTQYQTITNLVHSHGHQLILHSDGYIHNLIDMFIEIGFDGIQSIEPNSSNDLLELFKTFRDQICFIGNLDNTSMLTYASPSEVQNYVIRLIETARKYNSRLVISPTQQINSIAKSENVNMMIETVRRYNNTILS